jgi:hypothetical protein
MAGTFGIMRRVPALEFIADSIVGKISFGKESVHRKVHMRISSCGGVNS